MILTQPLPSQGQTRPRRVTVLGATGSIGRSTADLLLQDPEAYEVVALTANRDAKALADLAVRLNAEMAVLADEAGYGELRRALDGTGVRAAAGEGALIEAAAAPVDWLMSAIVGAAGLEPTLAALRAGTTVALANKECLVCAGGLFMAEAEAHGAMLLPVDSEHNAIFQALRGASRPEVARLILTASGGPFRDATLKDMAAATPEQAVAHPNWSMGAKISVDSATMMNKGLELIEAHHLFAVPPERLEVLVHRQSIVHSLVAFTDGSLLAQLGPPDMRVPIAHALGWPRRLETLHERLDLAAVARLDFEAPDERRFPALALAQAAMIQGGAAPPVLNAANEVAVEAFLNRRIGFLAIAELVDAVLQACRLPGPSNLDDVRALDEEGRRLARAALPA